MNSGVHDARQDTIVAIATAQGRAAIGIVRLSGPEAKTIAKQICNNDLVPRFAQFCQFTDNSNQIIDEGIAIFFPAPNSFTGEDIVELQSHGSPQALNLLQNHCCELGARLAKPGEFAERAFLNGKIDLSQAEAIADIIDAQSIQSLKSANESLQGKFKQQVETVLESLIELRVYIEGAMDFAEEEIDFLANDDLLNKFSWLLDRLNKIIESVKQAALLRHGVKVAIYGKPNVGKSTLLNQLIGREVAIVTEIAGTTRDQLEYEMIIDGIPVLLVDTAGVRNTKDLVEQEGVERAIKARQQADIVLNVLDATSQNEALAQKPDDEEKPTITVFNKMDLLSKLDDVEHDNVVYISAKENQGLDKLMNLIGQLIKSRELLETPNIARSRHVDALSRTINYINTAKQHLEKTKTGEIVAAELQQAQNALSEITGDYLPDDLLGEIFSRFCIGK